MTTLNPIETLKRYWMGLIAGTGPVRHRPTENRTTKAHRSKAKTRRIRRIAHESRRRNRAA